MSGVLVVGAGLAGSRCAEALRAGGYAGAVTVVGAEPNAPYERPALSKELLAGTRAPSELLLRPHETWAERDIDLRVGVTVERIDVRRKIAEVDGAEVSWDSLVVATGARPRSLPGAGIPNALVLRTLDDALALRAAIVPGSRLVVVGAGFIGAEVASTAIGLGAEVTIVEAAEAPLVRAVGTEVGLLLAARWREHGVTVRLGARIERSRPDRMELLGGERLAHDAVLVAVGAEPAADLLGDSAGIPTDACGRTEWPDVYACGDVARFAGGRVEHWTSAAGQAAAVASTILGTPTPYAEIPYFWSDQFGLRLQMVGTTAAGWSRVELDGEPGSFRARYLDAEGRTLAVLLANRTREIASARRELAVAA